MNDETALVARPYSAPMTAADLRAQVNLVQGIMKAVMKDGTHFGTIPGTPKPTLYKAGAEKLCATFHLCPSFIVDDLSGGDQYRYRVTCRATHQGTGIVVAEGVGSASSNEEKYKWRKAVCKEEFQATPEDRRRVKYAKGRESYYTIEQVRTEPADIDNTVLKMACKRAFVAATLNAVAASDIFTQDIEDLSAELRDGEDDGGEPPKRSAPKQPKPPQGVNGAAAAGDNAPATDGHIAHLRKQLSGENGGPTEAEALKAFGIESLAGITLGQWKAIRAWVDDPTKAPAK